MPERQITTYENRPADIPQNLWAILTDPIAMNPVLPDIDSFSLPPGFTEETWKEYARGYETTFIEEYPHPPEIVLRVCPGSAKSGNDKGHVIQARLISSIWLAPGESGQEFGMWDVNAVVRLTPWIPAEKTPQSFTFAGNIVPVAGVSPSTGMCIDCVNATMDRLSGGSS